MKIFQGAEILQIARVIANRIHAGERLSISATGQDGVLHALQSITAARTVIEEDGMDLSFRPHLVSKSRIEVSFRFLLLVQQV